jgi:carbamoyltransferase
MKIMGTKFFGHDSAIAILDFEKQEIFAMSTERVTRIKHDDYDIKPILDEYNIKDIDYVCHSFEKNEDQSYKNRYYGLHFLVLFRELFKPKYIKDISLIMEKKYQSIIPKLFINPLKTIRLVYHYCMINYNQEENEILYLKKLKIYMLSRLKGAGIYLNEISLYDHHLSHALGSYYLSPFTQNTNSTLALTLDGFGDGSFSKLYLFESQQYKLIADSKAPLISLDKKVYIDIASIGVIYSNFTIALDLRAGSDEGKVEALAAFGDKDNRLYSDLMSIYTIQNNTFNLNEEQIKKFYDLEYLKSELIRLGKENFSASLQTWLEDIVVQYLNHISISYPNITQLCLSGGVVANIIMSLNIYERTNFKNIYVLPAMGDEGGAIGSAIQKALELNQDLSWLHTKYMPYYGDSIDKGSIEKALKTFDYKINYQYIGENWPEVAAQSIANNKVISIVHGKMEFGPRALGNRSILANPINQDTRRRINATVKRRPNYQPFCPSILEEERERLFEDSFSHKHMAIAFRMKQEYHDKLPSAIHVDGTARPQFVNQDDNYNYYKILKKLKTLTGFGVCINTSFNLHGRTVVRTAEDAITDFIDCNIDELYIEGYKITSKEPNAI